MSSEELSIRDGRAPVSDCSSTKYSDDLLERILQSLRDGATRTAAAESNGIGRTTLYDWMSGSAYVSDSIARAEADFKSRVERKFGEDALSGDDWRARESLLKRRWREEWGDKLDVRSIPDELLLELAGVTRRTITAEAYPSAPVGLLAAPDRIEPVG